MTIATVEAKISEALFARLATLVLTPALPVAWPGIAFTPPSGAYLIADHVPNTNLDRYVGDDSSTEFRGILQVTVVGKSGEGVITATEIAGKVAEHFAKGTALQSGDLKIKIDGRANVASVNVDPDRVRLAVSINYYAFA